MMIMIVVITIINYITNIWILKKKLTITKTSFLELFLERKKKKRKMNKYKKSNVHNEKEMGSECP